MLTDSFLRFLFFVSYEVYEEENSDSDQPDNKQVKHKKGNPKNKIRIIKYANYGPAKKSQKYHENCYPKLSFYPIGISPGLKIIKDLGFIMQLLLVYRRFHK
ncbi:MAG: hypothetical protein C4291_00310 [Candidatus Dadabacteria bacterium]